jgi:hypothetical protein
MECDRFYDFCCARLGVRQLLYLIRPIRGGRSLHSVGASVLHTGSFCMEGKTVTRDLFERELRNKSDHMVAMNFKVSFEFRQAMKLYALKNGLSLREVFIRGFQLAVLGSSDNSEYPTHTRGIIRTLSAGDAAEPNY